MEISTENRGEWLKEMFKKKGFHNNQVADMLMIDMATLYRWYKQKDLSWEKMRKCADVLRVDLKLYFPDYSNMIGLESKNYKQLYLEQLEVNQDLRLKVDELQDIVQEYRVKNGTK
jgi:transcriptional regulator with XRE-family HTH domain